MTLIQRRLRRNHQNIPSRYKHSRILGKSRRLKREILPCSLRSCKSRKRLDHLARHSYGYLKQRSISWKWELSALIVCVTSLLALIITLVTHQLKPLPGYSHGITLNARVAVFSTIMKTTLLYCAAEAISQYKWIHIQKKTCVLSDIDLYDQASRGPWGALVLLKKNQWR